jgi:hypothetical protein
MESDFLQSRVNAGPANGRLGDGEREAEFFLGDAEDLDGLVHDFRADAVARERRDVVSFHESERTV